MSDSTMISRGKAALSLGNVCLSASVDLFALFLVPSSAELLAGRRRVTMNDDE